LWIAFDVVGVLRWRRKFIVRALYQLEEIQADCRAAIMNTFWVFDGRHVYDAGHRAPFRIWHPMVMAGQFNNVYRGHTRCSYLNAPRIQPDVLRKVEYAEGAEIR
jgi:hypothetical protein